MNDEIESAILRRAVGYDIREITEEYSGENELVKRKISTKHFPPDLAAAKAYVELKSRTAELTAMSDEELQKYKESLLASLLSKAKGEENENNSSEP